MTVIISNVFMAAALFRVAVFAFSPAFKRRHFYDGFQSENGYNEFLGEGNENEFFFR